jgi:hypothetical protein
MDIGDAALAHDHDDGDEAAVSALLGRPMPVRARDTAAATARPDAAAQAMRDCRYLLHSLSNLPVELVSGDPERPNPERSQALNDNPGQWFVRVTPDRDCVAVQALGGSDGPGHETLAPIEWVYYPRDPHGFAAGDFAQRLNAAVRYAAGLVDVYRRAYDAMQQLPIQRVTRTTGRGPAW